MRAARNRAGTIRIIGGRWRGTRIEVAARSGLRPTPDRVRETVFNWLNPYLDGAQCLDLYAGSGALTFEALSRGAAHATAIDLDPRVTTALTAVSVRLQADDIDVLTTNALHWLASDARAFDIVFVDPPFASGLLEPTLQCLAHNRWLAAGALVYVETARDTLNIASPWQVLKSARTREIDYALLSLLP